MPAQAVSYTSLPYVPQSYQDPGYGRTLADLMRQRGMQQAQMYLARGDAQANAWQNAGNAIMGAVSDWQRRVEDNRRAELDARQQAQREQANALAIESAGMDLAEKKRRTKGEETARAILPLARRDDGLTTYDRGIVQREMEAAGYADQLPDIFAKLDEQDAAHLKVLQARRDAVAGDAFRVLQSGADADTYSGLLEYWKANDALPAHELDAMRKLGADPQQRQQALLAAVQSSPTFASMFQKRDQPVTVGANQRLVDPRTGQVLVEAQPEPPKPVSVAEGAMLVNPETGQVVARGTPKREPQGSQAPIAVIGEDGRPVYVRPAEALGKQPASTREQVSGAEIPPDYKNALDRAILNLSATKRGPIVQLANRLAAEGQMDQLGDVIRQAAVDTENVDTKNQIVGRRALLASLQDTRGILEELKAKGVPTNWFTGSVEDLARKLGTSTNTEYVTLANRLQGTLINYRRAATGVAFSEREQQQYAKMFPNYKNTLPVNLALLDGLEREAHTYDQAYWTHKLGEQGAALVGVLPKAAGANGTKVGRFMVTPEP